MAALDTVRARIYADLEKDAAAAIAEMSLTLSETIRLMLVRVAADKALPFEVRMPNAKTKAAIEAAD